LRGMGGGRGRNHYLEETTKETPGWQQGNWRQGTRKKKHEKLNLGRRGKGVFGGKEKKGK